MSYVILYIITVEFLMQDDSPWLQTNECLNCFNAYSNLFIVNEYRLLPAVMISKPQYFMFVIQLLKKRDIK